jgi:hypothetical protein
MGRLCCRSHALSIAIDAMARAAIEQANAGARAERL